MNQHITPVGLGRIDWKPVLGVRVASVGWKEAIALLGRLAQERRFTRVSFLNAHTANLAASDPDFADALRSFLVLPDGVGVDLAARILYGAPFAANLNGTDFVPAFLQAQGMPMTVGLIGAKGRNVERAVERFASMCPQHRFILINDGFFSAADEPRVLERIRLIRPDVLLVAMGVPRQELWISRNIDERHCTLPIAVGALFDFMSGAVPRAPALVRTLRLEWVFRMMMEPMRLWRRYILGNPVFIARVVRQKLGLERRPA